ncbi:MAG TPA: helix-turn-helix domain-containing protein [Chitinophagaceae bacterium]|nr:helix-turn-helix domain-containing protein [Chitinophagaceae bacterium]
MYSTILLESDMKNNEMTSKAKENGRTQETCTRALIPVRDALDILNGKWKLPILIALSFGNKRFSELAKQVNGITDKMLSKELRELEMNELVKRTVYDSVPVVVEYSMTPYGETLDKLIEELQAWGTQHRKRIIKKGK